MPSDGLARNLEALSLRHPSLAAGIRQSAPDPRLSFRTAKDGSVVPVLHREGGDLPLHSLVNPRREAERLLASLRDCGYLVCFGLGGGFLAHSFLRQPQAWGLLIVEKDLPALRALLENLPLEHVLSDPRVRLTAGAEEIRAIVRSSYLPAVAGDLASMPLRPWCAAEEEFFGKAARELSRSAEEIRADYAVQARFGKRWFSNMILNLPAAAQGSFGGPVSFAGRPAHVTAAGPSLEQALAGLGKREDGSVLVATDTSLPALLRAGLRPEVAVSLDCQLYSYHHFLPHPCAETTVFFDLASPPFLVRRAGSGARFFSSAHPFARFIASSWLPLAIVDTTGGNVTHAAVSLARALGSPEVRVHGADFSYPRGKPYARGTYLYDYFQTRQTRCAPVESSLSLLVLGSAGLIQESGPEGTRYTTPTLLDYRTRIQALMAYPSEAGRPGEIPGRAPRSWQRFLRDYREAAGALPRPRAPLGPYFRALSGDQKTLWATLLPIAARVLHETGAGQDRAACLERSRQWALERMDRVLSAEAQAL